MSEELTVNQFISKLNENVPVIRKYKYLRINAGIITEARDAYHHFIISSVQCYNHLDRQCSIIEISGDELEFNMGTFYLKIYKKDKRMNDVFIDYEDDADKTMKILVINKQKKYKDNIFYDWDFQSCKIKHA